MRFFLFILFILVTNFSTAQEFRQYIDEGDRQFENNNYYGASWLYKKALTYEAELYDVLFKYANSCRLDYDYGEAERAYLRIIETSADKFPEAFFWIAEVQKSLGYYQKAQKNFREFLNRKAGQNEFLLKKAEKEVLSCEKAMLLRFDPVDLQIVHFDTLINTVNGEFGTSVISDSVFFYSSLVSYKESKDTNQLIARLFKTRILKDSILQKGTLLDSIINVRGLNVTNPFYHAKTGSLFFSISPPDRKNGGSKLYKCKSSEGKWSAPEPLPGIINLDGYSATQPTIAECGKSTYLLFVSDRPGGSGGLDIWYSPMEKEGSFSKVINLGIKPDTDTSLFYLSAGKSKLNTPGNDISPFFDQKDSTLYFSSDWHHGMGGFDIFKSKGNFFSWSEVENLGYPLNTGYNEVYPNLDSKGRYVFFTSNRKGSYSKRKESCCNDIWYYKMIARIKEDSLLTQIEKEKQAKEKEERQVKFFEEEIKLLVPLTLFFDNDYPDPKTTDTVTTANYEVLVDNYIKKAEEFRKKYSSGLPKREANIAAEESDEFFYKNVINGYNKLSEFAKLTEELLKKKQTVKITMKGYTSPLNTFDYNKKLAKRRISSLMNYFIQYNNGVFNEYIRNGLLIMEQVPVGKLENTGISEDLNDLRNSVYSPAASFERKIQVIAVQLVR